MSDSEHTNLALSWIKTGKIIIDKSEICSIEPGHKYAFLKSFFKSRDHSKGEKELLMHRLLGKDQSPSAEACRAQCEASLPDQASKAKVWSEITDPGSPDSPIEKAAKMEGFYSEEQLDLCEPYFDKFFEALSLQRRMNSYKGMCQFFHGMLPRLHVKDEYIFKLSQILYETPDH